MAGPSTITDELRQDILVGLLPPGERLVELDLSRRYQCGRAAVRSALVELAAEGLIDRATNRGATVRRVTVTEAIQITEARAALETLIAEHAAVHATDDDRIGLQAVLADMAAAVTDNDSSRYSSLNATLHRRIRDMSGHAVASDLVVNLHNRAAHHEYRLALVPGRAAESLQQHSAIVEAIVAGDRRSAANAMRSHLQSVAETLSRWGDAFGS